MLILYLFHVFQDPGLLGSRFFRDQEFLGPDFSGSKFFWLQVFQCPDFSGSMFFRVQAFLGPGFLGSKFFRVRVQVLGVAANFKYNDSIQFNPMGMLCVNDPINHSPPPISSLLFYYMKLFYVLFFSLFYFKPLVTPLFLQLFWNNIFIFSVLFFLKINLANIQFSHI